MSINIKKIILAIGFGVLSGFFLIKTQKHYFLTKTTVNKDGTKITQFMPKQLRMSKPGQTLHIDLSIKDGFPTDNNEATTIIATVTADNDLSFVLGYQWSLPAGAKIINGSHYGFLQGFSAGQSQQIEISVNGFSSEGIPRLIKLDISGKNQNSIVGASGVISSHPMQANLLPSYRPSKESLAQAESFAKRKLASEDNDISASETTENQTTEDLNFAKPEAAQIPKGVHF